MNATLTTVDGLSTLTIGLGSAAVDPADGVLVTAKDLRKKHNQSCSSRKRMYATYLALSSVVLLAGVSDR